MIRKQKNKKKQKKKKKMKNLNLKKPKFYNNYNKALLKIVIFFHKLLMINEIIKN